MYWKKIRVTRSRLQKTKVKSRLKKISCEASFKNVLVAEKIKSNCKLFFFIYFFFSELNDV